LGDLAQAKFLGLDLARTASYDVTLKEYDWQYAVEVETSEDLQKNAARSLERRVMVEAAGQLIHLFRDGLDYAFILRAGCGACYSRSNIPRILVSAPCARLLKRRQPAYESLQGRPEVCPLPTPRRCHSAGGIPAVRLQGSPM
jgi:hypothetical protein